MKPQYKIIIGVVVIGAVAYLIYYYLSRRETSATHVMTPQEQQAANNYLLEQAHADAAQQWDDIYGGLPSYFNPFI